MGTLEKARHFRLRCNKARQLHREENKKIHAPNTKMYGSSEFDPLQLKLREDHDGEWWVYAERTMLDPASVELLSELD